MPLIPDPAAPPTALDLEEEVERAISHLEIRELYLLHAMSGPLEQIAQAIYAGLDHDDGAAPSPFLGLSEADRIEKVFELLELGIRAARVEASR